MNAKEQIKLKKKKQKEEYEYKILHNALPGVFEEMFSV